MIELEKLEEVKNNMSQTPLPHDHGQDMELNPERLPKTEAFKIVSDLFKQMG